MKIPATSPRLRAIYQFTHSPVPRAQKDFRPSSIPGTFSIHSSHKHRGQCPRNALPATQARARQLVTSKESRTLRCAEPAISSKNTKGRLTTDNALFAACESGDSDVAVCLVQELGADICARDERRCTPLHYAASRGDLEVVRFLGQWRGDKSSLGNRNGPNILRLAATNGHRARAHSLVHVKRIGVKLGAKDSNGRTALHNAAQNGHHETVRMLVEHGAKVGIRDRVGSTALHDAAMLGHLDTVRVLAEYGAKVDVIDGLGWSALHIAACSGELELIRVLVRELGADVDSKDAMGSFTPLHGAAGNGQHEAVRLLGKELGASVSFPSGFFTPVHTAAEFGQVETIRVLVGELGADVDAVALGSTPLDIAMSGDHDTIRQLKELGAKLYGDRTA